MCWLSQVNPCKLPFNSITAGPLAEFKGILSPLPTGRRPALLAGTGASERLAHAMIWKD